jgi:predicted molibdopterin-dependent oxidoreductase YjgC
MCRRTVVLEREEPECLLEINPADAKRIGIKPWDRVRVRSRRGAIEVKARVTGTVPEGILFLPFHFHEAAANLLTTPAADPNAKIPEFKVCAAAVEPLVKKVIRHAPPMTYEEARRLILDLYMPPEEFEEKASKEIAGNKI